MGFLQTIKDRKYVEIGDAIVPVEVSENEESDRDPDAAEPARPAAVNAPQPLAPISKPSLSLVTATDAKARKVFITHGKNEKAFIDPIKKLLTFGELEAVVADEKQTVSQPVPEKVMEDMRSCGAAII